MEAGRRMVDSGGLDMLGPSVVGRKQSTPCQVSCSPLVFALAFIMNKQPDKIKMQEQINLLSDHENN